MKFSFPDWRAILAAAAVLCGIFVTSVMAQSQSASAQPASSNNSASAQNGAMTGHDHMQGMDMDTNADTAGEASAMHEMMGHHHDPGPHMKMTALRPQSPGDADRAKLLTVQLREGIEKYKDYHVALAEGYKIFLPNLPQKEYHFTNYANGFLEAFGFDPARPTSLLYRKSKTGYELAGAMYTMPRNATEDQLNARVPLSVAQWHLHTNLCMPPRDQMRTADWAQFGLQGSIATEEACTAAGGKFHPVIFGWMVHVYPYEDSFDKMFAMHHDMH